MTWVLWDILVPLLCSFGLGVFLCWVLFSRYGLSLAPKANNADETVNATENITVDHGGDKNISSGAALSELEAANITLIGERDNASLKSEELSAQMEVIKTRNEELEAQSLELEIATQLDNPNTNDSVAETPGAPFLSIDTQDADNHERLQLRENVENLTNSLEAERSAKRELELQLLNIKNQCEKLEAQVSDVALESENPTDANTEERLSESEWRDQYESALQHTKSLEAELERKNGQIVEFEATALSSVQVHSEELNGAITNGVITNGDAKDVEIENLNATIARLEASAEGMTPTIEVDQYRAEITVRDAEIETLQSRLANVPIITAADTNAEVDTNNEANTPLSSTTDGTPSGWSIPEKSPNKKQRDKLTDIKGVGPAIEKLLHKSGVYYYRQIAELDKQGIAELQEQIPQFPGRIDRDKWVKQAKKLHRDKYGSTA